MYSYRIDLGLKGYPISVLLVGVLIICSIMILGPFGKALAQPSARPAAAVPVEDHPEDYYSDSKPYLTVIPLDLELTKLFGS